VENRQLLDLEEQFWRGNAEFYRQNLTADALMVLPDPAGVMTRDATVQSIGDSTRWQRVEMSDVTSLELSPGVMLLTYRATASRDSNNSAYTARATSVYVDRGNGPKLAFHQQTPTQA
jgi:hypothetical protein